MFGLFSRELKKAQKPKKMQTIKDIQGHYFVAIKNQLDGRYDIFKAEDWEPAASGINHMRLLSTLEESFGFPSALQHLEEAEEKMLIDRFNPVSVNSPERKNALQERQSLQIADERKKTNRHWSKYRPKAGN